MEAAINRFPILLGATDETYGTVVWLSRVENLRIHLKLIQDHLPDDAKWLRNQVSFAIKTAEEYIEDAVPTEENA